jgi:RNA polymerase sigma factor (sigma-70 family)
MQRRKRFEVTSFVLLNGSKVAYSTAMNSTPGREADVSAGLFNTTHWSVVLRAQDKSEADLALLCESYRAPLLLWLRRRGHDPPDAEDLVQGFFAHLLKQDFLRNVSAAKGRFRTFILTALKNYLFDQYSKHAAVKRGGGQAVESLQETTEDGGLKHDPAASGKAPDEEYDRAWAGTVLANAQRQLKQECAHSGHGALCAALEPSLFADETACSYQEIGEHLGMSEGAVKMGALRIRGRLKRLIREQVLQTVTDEKELEQELRYLISLFGR